MLYRLTEYFARRGRGIGGEGKRENLKSGADPFVEKSRKVKEKRRKGNVKQIPPPHVDTHLHSRKTLAMLFHSSPQKSLKGILRNESSPLFSGESALVVTVLCPSSAAQMHSKCTKQPSATYFHLFFWRAIAAAVAPKNSVSIGRKRGAGGNGFGGLLKRFSSPLPFWCHCPPFPPSCAYVHVAWLRMCFFGGWLGVGGKGGEGKRTLATTQ